MDGNQCGDTVRSTPSRQAEVEIVLPEDAGISFTDEHNGVRQHHVIDYGIDGVADRVMIVDKRSRRRGKTLNDGATAQAADVKAILVTQTLKLVVHGKVERGDRIVHKAGID